MRKVVIHGAGGYERLTLEESPDPKPGPGEVTVEVAAIGVNYADCVVRMGLYASAKEFVGWPITPGFEVAGHVAALGEGVEDLEVGDAVLAVTLFGGYTSHLCVARDQIFTLPRGFDLAQAAAFPAVQLTAWYALFELAHPQPGQSLLIHSAAGGVGGALLQLGRIAECRCVGVVGASHKVAIARERGAHEVIDKSTQSLWREAERISPSGYDVVLDANGVATLRQSYAHLASPGKLIIYGFHTMLPRGRGRPRLSKLAVDWLRTPRFDPLRMTNDNKSVMAFNLSYLFERRDILQEAMTQLLSWADEGRITPPETTRYPLDAVAEAHRALEGAQTVGKLVLEP